MSIPARTTLLSAAWAVTLATLLAGAPPAQAQMSEPSLPSGCTSVSNPMDPYASTSSTATSISVTFKDPMPSAYSATGDHTIYVCYPNATNVYQTTRQPSSRDVPKPVAGTTYTLSTDVRDGSDNVVHTLTADTDYWIGFGGPYTNLSEWKYIRTGSEADTTVPTLSSAGVDGSRIDLHYNEALDTTSTPATTDFTVSVAGTDQTPTSVWVSGQTVSMNLGTAATAGQTVTVSYTKGMNPIQDVAGNDAANLSSQSLTNVTGDTTKPTLSSATVVGARLTLNYNEALNTGATPAATAFTVTVAGTDQTPTAVSVAGSSVTLTLGTAATAGQTVTVAYAILATNNIQDLAGSIAAALSSQAVTNYTPPADTSVPTLSSAGVDGSRLDLHYNKALDTTSTPATTDFTVTVAGTDQTPTSVWVSGQTVSMNLGTAATAGQAVTVTYTVPGTNPIQDVAGNDAAALSSQSVTNVTGDTTKPTLSSATVNGATLKLNYNEALSTGSVPATTAFTVSVAGTDQTPTSVWVSGQTVGMNLGTAATAGQTVTVAYAILATNSIKDLAGSIAAAFSGQAVANETSGAPTLLSATVNGATLTLNYNKALDTTSTPATADFTVSVAGTDQTPTGVAVVGQTVTLTLGTAPTDGQTVTVSYTAGMNPIQDLAGNDAAALSSQSVTNNTGVSSDPAVTIAAGTSPVTEGTAATFTVTVATAPSANLTVNLTVSEAAGSSYVDSGDEGSKTVTINSGSTTATYSVTTQADTTYEPNGSVTVTVAAGTGYTVGTTSSASVTVIDDDALISNIGQANSGNEAFADFDSAQGFTTGAASDGYTLDSIEVVAIAALSSNARVRVASGSPNSFAFVATLTNPSSLAAGTLTFSAPSGTTLDASTTYYVVLDTTTSGSLGFTNSDSEDSGGASGWSIADNRWRKGTGNWTSASTSLRIRVNDDSTIPVLKSAVVNGSTLTLNYNEALDTGSTPATTDFTVSVAGTNQTPTNVAVAGKRVTVTLGTAATAGQAVTVTYTAGTNPIRDLAPINAADLSGESVINITGDATVPTFSSATVNGTEVVVTFGEALDTTSVPATTDFTVTVAGTDQTPTNVEVSGSAVTLTLGTAATDGQAVTVTYTKGTNPIRDWAGNDAAGLSTQTVSNITDTIKPSLSSARVDGTSLTLDYSEALDTGSEPAASAFTVTVAGANQTPTAVSVAGNSVTLTLGTAATAGQTVTVSYTVPGTNPIQDLAGLDADALSSQAVTNITGDLLVGNFTQSAAGTALDLASNKWNAQRFTTGAYPDGYTLTNVKLNFPTAPGSDISVKIVSGLTNMNTGTEVATLTNPATLSTGILTFAAPASTTLNASTEYAVVVNGGDPGEAASTTGTGESGATGWTIADQRSFRSASPNYGHHPNVMRISVNGTLNPDTTVPTFVSATVNGQSLELTFSEDLDTTSTPRGSFFRVTRNPGSGTPAINVGTPGTVTIVGKTVTVPLATPVLGGETLVVTYVGATFAVAPLRDLAGNNAADFFGQTATNNTPDTAAPNFDSAFVNGTLLKLLYNEALDAGSTPAVGSFTVTVAGTDQTPTGVAVSGRTVTLTLGTAAAAGDTVTVSYTKPGSNPIQDAAGNDAGALSSQAVTNVTGDVTVPVLQSATLNDNTLWLSYNEALDPGSVPGLVQFAVAVSGVGNLTPVGVAVFGSTVRLTLHTTVASGTTVTLTYATPSGVDEKPIQDLAGNDAAAFLTQAVTNATGDMAVPTLDSAAVEGVTLTLTYNEALDTVSVPATTDFAVSVGGTNRTVSTVEMFGSAVTLTLSSAVTTGQTVTVNYTKGTNPIQDWSGNDAAALSTQTVTVSDTTKPTVDSVAVDGTKLDITFTESLDTTSTPQSSAFTVTATVSGTSRTINGASSAVTISGATVAATLTSAVLETETVTVSYTKGTTTIDDLAGNSADAFSNQAATNNSVVPTVSSATVNGSSLVITFSEAMNAAGNPASSAFIVSGSSSGTINGSSAAVTIDSAAVTVTLASAVVAGETVTVDYTANARMFAKRVQDLAGSRLADFSGQAVTNATGDTTKPTFDSATVNGSTLEITFNEDLDTASKPIGSRFAVEATPQGGTARNISGTAAQVSIAGKVVTVTLAEAVEHGESVTASYAVGDDANPLRDVAGNNAADFSGETVTNNTPDTTAPAVSSVMVSSSAGLDNTYIIGEAISFTVAFDENVTVTGTPRIPFTLGTATKQASFASGSTTASLVFSYTVLAGDVDADGIAVGENALTLNGGTIQDGAMNNANLDHAAIAADASHKVEGVRPTLVVTAKQPTVVGTKLTMTFSEPLGAAPSLANGAFVVKRTRSGTEVTVVLDAMTPPSVSGRTVTLTQSTPTLDGDTNVKVSYTKPTTGTGNRIRDVAGNEAADFMNQPVFNNPKPVPPTFDDGASKTLTIAENHDLTMRVGTVDAGDANGDTLTYSLASGGDNAFFTIGSPTEGASGEIWVKDGVTLDFERKETYSITARVTDGKDADGNDQANPTIDATIAVTINVTDVAEPPLAPAAPRVQSAPRTAQDGSVTFDVRVNWSAPDNTGRPRIDDYDVRWVAADSDPGQTGDWIVAGETGGVIHDGTGTSATILGLAADTTYRVQVRAGNAEGATNWSASGVGNTAVSSASASGTRLTITFNVDLDASSVPPATAFTVSVVDNSGQARAPADSTFTVKAGLASSTVTVESVAVAGRSVTLTLDSAVAPEATVTVDYTPPTGMDATPLKDTEGDPLPALDDLQVEAPRPSGGGGGGGGGTPRNQAPEATDDIVEQMLRAGAALEFDLSKHFSDADEDVLDYAAESSDPAVALVSVDGAVLTVRGGGGGSAEIEVTATDPDGDSATQTFAVTVTAPEAVWYLPPASDPMRQGFVRVVNHSQVEGEATVTATDDAGQTYPALTLALDAREAAHFNSDDLELGNAAKDLTGSTGAGTGGWRLAVESDDVDVEALGYVRTTDGFLTAMGDVAPLVDGARKVATFNPGSNVNQVSLLRLVNPANEDVEATVTGVDDAGRSPGDPVLLTVAAGASCTVDAAQLESGSGLACGLPQAGLGDGDGKWRLRIESDVPLVAMSLLSSPTGHLTNLSGTNEPDDDGVWRVPLFPAAADALGRQGFVRVINRSDSAGQVTITASDDSDVDYEVLTLALDAGAAVHFNSDDLELGNSAKGLTGSTGSGMGTWRLALAGDDAAGAPIAFEAHAYIRTADGFLTPMNGQAPERDGVHRIAFFNPGSNTNQVSTLRLINPGMNNRWVRIAGTDDTGVRPGTAVRVLVPATDALELTAAELESGESVEPDVIDSGAIGDGSGKWRLHVEADPEVAVLSLLSSPTGHLTNLSRADAARGYESGVAAPLPPPATVTLESPAPGELRGRWSVVEGARYGVDLLQDGVRDDDRSLSRSTRNTFRWQSLSRGTYTIRACSVNEERVCGPWSAESNEVVID